MTGLKKDFFVLGANFTPRVYTEKLLKQHKAPCVFCREEKKKKVRLQKYTSSVREANPPHWDNQGPPLSP